MSKRNALTPHRYLTWRDRASSSASHSVSPADRNVVIGSLTEGIFSICGLRKIPFKPDHIRPYLEQLDAHDALQRGAAGEHEGSQDGDGEGDDGENPHRGRKRSLRERLSSPDGTMTRSCIDPSGAGDFLDSIQVEVYSQDPKEAVRDLLNSFHAPALPESLWKPVLLDRFVDFDAILSGSYAVEAEEPQQLVLAVNFAFDGRYRELRTIGPISTTSSVADTPRCTRASLTMTERQGSSLDSVAMSYSAKSANSNTSRTHTFSMEESPSPLCGPKTKPPGGPKPRNAPRRSAATLTEDSAGSARTNAMDVDIPYPSAPTSCVTRPEHPARSSTLFESAARPHFDWFAELEEEDEMPDATSFLPKYMRGMAWKLN
ncbi:hypothetical protein B0H13DRAFT_2127034, partial [Mycena leptocephala]